MTDSGARSEVPKYPNCRCVDPQKKVCFFCEDTVTEEISEEPKKGAEVVENPALVEDEVK